MRKFFKNNILQVDKKRKRDDESDVSEGFDYAKLARCAAEAAIGPCDTGVFRRSEIRPDKASDRKGIHL